MPAAQVGILGVGVGVGAGVGVGVGVVRGTHGVDDAALRHTIQ